MRLEGKDCSQKISFNDSSRTANENRLYQSLTTMNNIFCSFLVTSWSFLNHFLVISQLFLGHFSLNLAILQYCSLSFVYCKYQLLSKIYFKFSLSFNHIWSHLYTKITFHYQSCLYLTIHYHLPLPLLPCSNYINHF